MSYHGVTKRYKTCNKMYWRSYSLPVSASLCHILAITFMIQKVYDTHVMVKIDNVHIHSYAQNYFHGNKMFGLRFSDVCSLIVTTTSNILDLKKHIAYPSSKPCRLRIALLNQIVQRPLWDQIPQCSGKRNYNKISSLFRWMVLWPGTSDTWFSWTTRLFRKLTWYCPTLPV